MKSAATMDAIASSSREIEDIVSVVDSIAFQTNILALNAAVEAARAGESGRGFAVVASEVRSLGSRSASAAREIKTLIASGAGEVDIGRREAGEARVSMDAIVQQVTSVSELIGQISSSTYEQAAGVVQVGDAISEIDQVTQQNAAMVEQSTLAVEQLRAQATQLSQLVGVFRLGPPAAHNGQTAHLAMASFAAGESATKVLQLG